MYYWQLNPKRKKKKTYRIVKFVCVCALMPTLHTFSIWARHYCESVTYFIFLNHFGEDFKI